jgi:hypothetical protein
VTEDTPAKIDKDKLDLNGSLSAAFAQRAVLAGFQLISLGRDFVQRDPCRNHIGAKVYELIGKKKWKRGESDLKRKSDSARYFTEWFYFKRATQPATLRKFLGHSPHLAYLHGLDDLNNAPTRIGSAPNHLLLLALALHALEINQGSHGEACYSVKRRMAEDILSAVLDHWRPDGNGVVDVESMRIGGWSLWDSQGPSPQRGLSGMQIYQQPCSFSVSEEVGRQFRQKKDVAVLDYLLSLAFDYEPLPIGVHLRWGLDLLTATIANQCLVICEAMPESAAKRRERLETVRFDADGLQAIVENFCVHPKDANPKALLRLVERLPRVEPNEAVARAVWWMDSIALAAKLVATVLNALTTGMPAMVSIWNKSDPSLPLSRSTRASEPFEQALDAAAKLEDPYERLEAFCGSLERRESDSAREPPPPSYGQHQELELYSEEWYRQTEKLIKARFDLAGELYDSAKAQNRRPARHEYLEFLQALRAGASSIRALTPGAQLADIRRAMLKPKKATARVVVRRRSRPQ